MLVAFAMRAEGGRRVAGSEKYKYTDRLLITGAAGNMGRMLRPLLSREGRVLRLSDLTELSDLGAGEESIAADVTDGDAMAKACQGMDAVLHLGGISVEATFEDVLSVNVAGTHNLLRAAVDAGVGKVILASSNHAVGFYRRGDVPPNSDGLPGDVPPRPDTYYGWSKAAIESLGALFHERYGIDVTVLRIGTCFPEPPDARALSTWLAPSDAAVLVNACLEYDQPGFRVLWAISDNTRRWWSLAGAKALGYESTDDAERFAAARIARYGEPDLTDPLHDLVGGAFCQAPLGEPM
jgi:nucleoside-diphosphate-sugar epimerase